MSLQPRLCLTSSKEDVNKDTVRQEGEEDLTKGHFNEPKLCPE